MDSHGFPCPQIPLPALDLPRTDKASAYSSTLPKPHHSDAIQLLFGFHKPENNHCKKAATRHPNSTKHHMRHPDESDSDQMRSRTINALHDRSASILFETRKVPPAIRSWPIPPSPSTSLSECPASTGNPGRTVHRRNTPHPSAKQKESTDDSRFSRTASQQEHRQVTD